MQERLLDWSRQALAAVNRMPSYSVLLCGALLFVFFFFLGYEKIPEHFYRYRDDGVITLSHARNWVDFGFIGVNPSGERVEATSAPLQMLLYALAYAATGMDYFLFMDLQTWVCTALLGGVFAAFFLDRPAWALSATAFGAWFLAQRASFMEWHGSGMENAITHVSLLATVFVLVRAIRRQRIDPWVWAVPLLASVSRVDSIFFVGPVLIVAAFWYGRVCDRRGWLCIAGVGLLWAGIQFIRWAYFGSFQPNTAVAQGISLWDRLLEFATIPSLFLNQPLAWSERIFFANGAHYLLLLAPMLLFRDAREHVYLIPTFAATVLILAMLTPVVFGAARLDVTRTTTQMAPFVALAIASALIRFRPRRIHLYAAIPAVVAFLLVNAQHGFSPYPVCCDARIFEQSRASFAKLTQQQDMGRATLANPDLGVVSGSKAFNVVDLGFLGSPVLSRLRGDPAAATFFHDLIAPELVQAHGTWACENAAILIDPRFQARYQRFDEFEIPDKRCGAGVMAPVGLWLRRDMLRASPSVERAYADELKQAISVERVSAELVRCEQRHDPVREPFACAYVARGAYRLLPEFRQAGERDRLLAVFSNSRTAVFDRYLLAGDIDGQAHRRLIEWLRRTRT